MCCIILSFRASALFVVELIHDWYWKLLASVAKMSGTIGSTYDQFLRRVPGGMSCSISLPLNAHC